jgi:hypothetical protein
MRHATGESRSVGVGKSHSLVPRRILRTCRENIAYNTLPYNFTRMLPVPHIRAGLKVENATHPILLCQWPVTSESCSSRVAPPGCKTETLYLPDWLSSRASITLTGGWSSCGILQMIANEGLERASRSLEN